MKKKKWLLVSLIFLGCIFIFAFSMILSGKRNTVEKLISQLENAINEHDIEKILDLYPDYCRADVVKCRHKAPYCRKIKQYGAFLLLICY